MEPQLVVIGGYATAGKDAVANILVQELGWYKTYMSYPLERALLTIDPYIPCSAISGGYWIRYSELHKDVGYDESKKNPEVRRILQTLGTEVGRNMFGEDVWLDLVCVEVADALADRQSVVVTGVRYPNELVRFKELGGISLWVERAGVSAVNTHSSDNTLRHDDFDIWCSNNGTLEDLKNWTTSYFKE